MLQKQLYRITVKCYKNAEVTQLPEDTIAMVLQCTENIFVNHKG